MRWARLLVAVAVVVVAGGGWTAHAWAGDRPSSAVADQLVHLGTETVSDRVEVVRLSTPALGGPTEVRVLLPEGFDPSGRTRYPVLYLLHGASGSSTSWLSAGGAEAATAGQQLIVVMPEGGMFGFYTDWWNFGAGGPPQWETYHLGQLVPWIDANYPTRATRDGRAVAGLSMGGLGALHYAATRPDLFTAAASFSGAIDTSNLFAPPVIEVAAMAEYPHLPTAVFGPRLTNEVLYRGHNPIDLAENLRGLLIQIDTGDGFAGGPLGSAGVPLDPVEVVMHEMGLRMHARLDALGIAHGWNPFRGCHCWTDWARDLQQMVPRLVDRFAQPVPPPEPFSYTSIHPSYQVYGWEVSIERPEYEFSRLFGVTSDGFALRGSGSARVTSPERFGSGEQVAVTVTDATGTTTSTLAADGAGRLTVPVSLGPANPFPQYTVPGNLWALGMGAAPGEWPAVTATVRFAAAAAAPEPPRSEPRVPVSRETAPDGTSSGRLPATGGGSATVATVVLALAALGGREAARRLRPRVGG